MLWNEPNNLSHWDFELDPEWEAFAEMTKQAALALTAETPSVPRVLGGMSPIDPNFIANMKQKGVLELLDAVAVHGFSLDWNHWQIEEWPERIAMVRNVTDLPIWVSEVGVSSFGAEEVQEFGLRRTHQLLQGLSPRIHWYSLFDLPRAWPATTRHRESEGSSYYRHFYRVFCEKTARRSVRFRCFANTFRSSVFAMVSLRGPPPRARSQVA